MTERSAGGNRTSFDDVLAEFGLTREDLDDEATETGSAEPVRHCLVPDCDATTATGPCNPCTRANTAPPRRTP